MRTREKRSSKYLIRTCPGFKTHSGHCGLSDSPDFNSSCIPVNSQLVGFGSIGILTFTSNAYSKKLFLSLFVGHNENWLLGHQQFTGSIHYNGSTMPLPCGLPLSGISQLKNPAECRYVNYQNRKPSLMTNSNILKILFSRPET